MGGGGRISRGGGTTLPGSFPLGGTSYSTSQESPSEEELEGGETENEITEMIIMEDLD